MAAVDALVRAAEEAPFDIDEVSDRDVSMPTMPATPVRPEQLDGILHDERLLAPGVECDDLEPATYALRLPGPHHFNLCRGGWPGLDQAILDFCAEVSEIQRE